MILPTREEIAERAREFLKHEDGVLGDTYQVMAAFAETEIARLRPARESLQQTATAERTRYVLANAGWEEMNRQNNILRAALARVTEHANHYSEEVGELVLQRDDLNASLARKDEALRACVEVLEEVVDTTCAPNPTNPEEWRVAAGHGVAFARAITKARVALARAQEAGR